MYSGVGDTTSLVPGFPIRTSSDPRSVGSSPRHNAASHVLHRLPVPRHPPCALKHLQHKTKKMSHHLHAHPKDPAGIRKICITYRHTTPHNEAMHQMLATTIHKSNTTPHHQSGATTRLNALPSHNSAQAGTPPRGSTGLLSQSPIVCLMIISPDVSPPKAPSLLSAPDPHPLQVTGHPTNRPDLGEPPHDVGRPESRGAP